MQHRILFSLLILAFAGSAVFQSCQHEPLDFITDDTPIDTTGGGPDTIITSNCDPDSVYFENDVFPILISNCAISGCHDAITQEEDINLSSYTQVMASGIMKPSDPYDSEFFDLVTETGEDRMPPPPQSPLTDEEIALIILWQEQGALDNACTDCDTTTVTFSGTIQPILNAYCVGCHDADSPSGGISLTAYLGTGSNDGIVDVAGDGRLLGAIQGVYGYEPMPPGTTMLPDCLIDQIRIWVEAGYPE